MGQAQTLAGQILTRPSCHPMAHDNKETEQVSEFHDLMTSDSTHVIMEAAPFVSGLSSDTAKLTSKFHDLFSGTPEKIKLTTTPVPEVSNDNESEPTSRIHELLAKKY